MRTERKFYVHAPQNVNWDTTFPKVVIEAEYDPQTVKDLPYFRSIKVLAPSTFSECWPTVRWLSFIECTGPARQLTDDEYVELVHKLIPKLPLPEGYQSKITRVYDSSMEQKENEDASRKFSTAGGEVPRSMKWISPTRK